MERARLFKLKPKWHPWAARHWSGTCFCCPPADSKNIRSRPEVLHSTLNPLWSMSTQRHELCPLQPWSQWALSPAWPASVLNIHSTKIHICSEKNANHDKPWWQKVAEHIMNETVTDFDRLWPTHTSLELLAIVVPAVAHVVALVLHNPYALSKHAQKSNPMILYYII